MLTVAHDLVPANHTGKPSDLEFSVSCLSSADAHELFNKAMTRLLRPEQWHQLAGWASAHFLAHDNSGKPVARDVEVGDFLRIDIPGPGPGNGHGYDWVMVTDLEDDFDPAGDQEWIAMKVHPSAEPGRSGVAAHFFKSEASSTFVIQRYKNNVISRYHGRNEVPNTSTDRPLDNLRNAMVAGGAMISFSEVQWSALCKAFIALEKPGGK